IGVRIGAGAATANLPVISTNAIAASGSKYGSYGVLLQSANISSKLDRNFIGSSTALFSYAVLVKDCGNETLLRGNHIQAGAGTFGQFIMGQPGAAFGVAGASR